MQNIQIAERIKFICKSQKKTVSKMLIDCNISKSLIYDMEKRNMSPSCDKLARIADYLDCSVDYLLGRTDEQTGTYHANNVSSSFVQNDGAVTLGSVSVSSAFNNNSNDIASSKEETEILNIYRSLNIRDKSTFLNFILNMEDKAIKA